jgi:hypothetical protein
VFLLESVEVFEEGRWSLEGVHECESRMMIPSQIETVEGEEEVKEPIRNWCVCER